MTQTTAARSAVSNLSTANMRSELTTFSEFYNRYYITSYGKQASDWLLGEFWSVVSASGDARLGQGLHALVSAEQHHRHNPRAVIQRGRRRWRAPGLRQGPQQGANTLESHWHVGEDAGLPGSGDIFDSYRSNGAVVKAIAAAGHDGGTATTPWASPRTYTTTGYVNMQCGYGCSDHASATAAGYPSAFVIDAAMSRMSPVHPHGLGRRVHLELLPHAGAR
ncbi:hypothetical protein DL767_008083 [Monosporascus sp. MG133]|nr:hypothetical protein DL767_008083 [Monosporascus sp. MG133]